MAEWTTYYSTEQELASVFITPTNKILASIHDGEILDLGDSEDEKASAKLILRTGGQPTNMCLDENARMFICDYGHNALLTTAKGKVMKLIYEYEERPFHGPSSVALGAKSTIFFTDSGPLGTTSLEHPTGSVYMASQLGGSNEQKGRFVLQPLLNQCLAHPSGIAVDESGDVLYVAETMRNRVLRGVRIAGAFHFSVFRQFSGMVGPTCLALSKKGNLVVGRMDGPKSPLGEVVVLNPKGAVLGTLSCPGSQVASLALDSADKTLYVVAGTKVFRTPFKH